MRRPVVPFSHLPSRFPFGMTWLWIVTIRAFELGPSWWRVAGWAAIAVCWIASFVSRMFVEDDREPKWRV